jgi:hypothetical protein
MTETNISNRKRIPDPTGTTAPNGYMVEPLKPAE